MYTNNSVSKGLMNLLKKIYKTFLNLHIRVFSARAFVVMLVMSTIVAYAMKQTPLRNAQQRRRAAIEQRNAAKAAQKQTVNNKIARTRLLL